MDLKSILPFLGFCSACFLLVALWFFLRPLIKRYYYTKPAKDEPIEFYEHKRGIARYRRMRKQLNKAQDSELYRYLGIAPLPIHTLLHQRSMKHWQARPIATID